MASHEWKLEDVLRVEELGENDLISGLPHDQQPSAFLAEHATGYKTLPRAPRPGHLTPDMFQGYCSDGSIAIHQGLLSDSIPRSTDLHLAGGASHFAAPWPPLDLTEQLGSPFTPQPAFSRLATESWTRETTAELDSPSTCSSFSGLPDDSALTGISREPSTPPPLANTSFFPTLPPPGFTGPLNTIPMTGFEPLLGVPYDAWCDQVSGLPYSSADNWSPSSGSILSSADSLLSFAAPGPSRTPLPWAGTKSQMPFAQHDGNLYPFPTGAGFPNHSNLGPCVSPSQTLHGLRTPTPEACDLSSPLWPLADHLVPEPLPVHLPVTTFCVPPRRDVSMTPDQTASTMERQHIPAVLGREFSASAHPRMSPGPDSLSVHASRKWGDLGRCQDQDLKDAALIEMRDWGMSYKAIKDACNFPEALATLRGRHRNMTTPSQERVRRPPWQSKDVQLLFDAVRDQNGDPKSNRPRVSWKGVAHYMHEHGASYKFSYVTCSQKWREIASEGRSSYHFRTMMSRR